LLIVAAVSDAHVQYNSCPLGLWVQPSLSNCKICIVICTVLELEYHEKICTKTSMLEKIHVIHK